MSEARRGGGARLGIAALNILLPGLGLLRTGDGRLGAAFIGAFCGFLLLLLGWFAAGPELTFASWSVLMLGLLAVYPGGMLLSAFLSWRRSAGKRPPRHWWSRWYGIAAIAIAFQAANLLALEARTYYQNFYIPSDGMAPTLVKGERFVARMRNFGPLRRGDIVLVQAPGGATYVKRIAGLPGDRIGL